MSLQKPRFTALPLGAVRPADWLLDQLRTQVEGLTGHLDEFWPDIAQSRWIGGAAEGWERGPYWLDGLVPAAFLLDDDRLKEKARFWIDYILAHQHPDGWLGERDDPHVGEGSHALDPWPLFVLFKVFTQWQEATDDDRIVPAMVRACRCLADLLAAQPLTSWARMRWADFVLSIHWLYEQTGEAWLLDLAGTAHGQGFDWQDHFENFRFTGKTAHGQLGLEVGLPLHGVNNAMGVKSGVVWARQSGRDADARGSFVALAQLERHHGQITGMFSGDEHLAGRDPAQGTELCTVVELMFSLEIMLTQTGEAALGDQLERIAFNALPATCTADMWAHQYDQQPNQVLVSLTPRQWTSNGPDSNLYGLEPNFGCCTANLHQGWPKLVAAMWMQTEDGGLAATVLGPCRVTADLPGAGKVTIHTATDYPFDGGLRFEIGTAAPAAFPLLLRIPAWAAGARVRVRGGGWDPVTPGAFHRLTETWRDGDIVELDLPTPARLETREGGAVGVLCGPLVMALKMEEEFRYLRGEVPHADWEVFSASPWNYALAPAEGEVSVEKSGGASGRQPFLQASAPLTLRVPARRLPQWQMHQSSAGPLPPSPAATGEPLEMVELIPYGCTNLRIAEFPVAHGGRTGGEKI